MEYPSVKKKKLMEYPSGAFVYSLGMTLIMYGAL
jgi:hypothetical protein